MAIKIIKNTMVDPIEITCEECESIIEYNYQDIQSGFTSGLFGFEKYERYIVCPVCKARIDLRPIAKISEETKDE